MPHKQPDKIAVLHVALDPVTGPWSVMRELAKAQTASGIYAGVGIGVAHSSNWPDRYMQELRGLGLPFYCGRTLKAFGTAQFLWQRYRRPPISVWADALADSCGSSSVVVHFHNAWMSGVFLPLSSRKVPVRAISTFHGVNAALDGKPIRRRLHRWMAQRLMRYGVAITSVDDSNLALARRFFGIDPAAATVIPNGVPEPALAARPWGGSGEFIVGHLGTISERKGWHIAVAAVQQVVQTGRRVRLLIAGTGPEEAAARTEAQASGGHIEYLGHVAKPSLDFLPRLHALAVMSAHEGLPMSIIEALAAGVPVLATPVGGVPAAVHGTGAARLMQRDSNCLASAIAELYDSPDTALLASDAARKLFQRRFEISRIVTQYDAVYRRQSA